MRCNTAPRLLAPVWYFSRHSSPATITDVSRGYEPALTFLSPFASAQLIVAFHKLSISVVVGRHWMAAGQRGLNT